MQSNVRLRLLACFCQGFLGTGNFNLAQRLLITFGSHDENNYLPEQTEQHS